MKNAWITGTGGQRKGEYAFPSLLQFLQILSNLDCTYRSHGCQIECNISKCVEKRSSLHAVQREVICALIENLSEYYLTTIQHEKSLRKISIELWVKGQEKGAKLRAANVDTNYP